MKKDITQRKGTVAYVLSANKEQLFNLINAYKINEARHLAINLLDDSSITDREAAEKAKNIFRRSGNNLFLSTLMTYMLGVKASI